MGNTRIPDPLAVLTKAIDESEPPPEPSGFDKEIIYTCGHMKTWHGDLEEMRELERMSRKCICAECDEAYLRKFLDSLRTAGDSEQ